MKTTAKGIGCCLLALSLLLVLTQPSRLPSVVLIIPYFLMFAVLALSIALIVSIHRGSMTGRALRAGCVSATLPMLLLVLQSVGQLTWRDTLTLFALFGITYFYMSKINAKPGLSGS